MLIVSPSTLVNAHALETRAVPKRMLGRIAVIPRRGAGKGVKLRLLIEMQMLRYLLPLTPFVAAMILWPHLALPISQAPVPMMLVIAMVEMKVLSMSPDARKRLLGDAEIARTRDALRFNGIRALTRIAARRGWDSGEVVLVVEQSELARITPLTLVSVQRAQPVPEVLDLDPEDHAILEADLFDADFTERTLHLLSLAQNENLHSIALETSEISAHARMAAVLADQKAAVPA